ncbi:MAG: hypothetical protein HY962_05355 [Ignavibacteriae bacterium]|nr:hypothetical protein [Ignavibacteriota bacterium]
MKRTLSLLALVVCLCGTTAQAQYYHVGERTWTAFRGGIGTGINYTMHTGDIPVLPFSDNTNFTKGGDVNFTLQGFVEKPFTRSFAFGLKLAWDPMSATVEQNTLEPYRITDPQGQVYDVRRDHVTEYILRYVTIGGYVKIYPVGGPGFFVGGGASMSILTTKRFVNNATITEPEWAIGTKGTPLTGPIDNANPLRASVDLMLGYEVFFAYGFLSPQVQYNYGFGSPIDEKYAESWSIDNVRLLINFALPLYQ